MADEGAAMAAVMNLAQFGPLKDTERAHRLLRAGRSPTTVLRWLLRAQSRRRG